MSWCWFGQRFRDKGIGKFIFFQKRVGFLVEIFFTFIIIFLFFFSISFIQSLQEKIRDSGYSWYPRLHVMENKVCN